MSRQSRMAVLCGAIASALGTAMATAAPVISQAFASRFQITSASTPGDLPVVTQMAFGPDGRLYVTSFQGQISSYAFNTTTGALTDKQSAGVQGFGLAFATHAVPGGGTQSYMYVARNDYNTFEGSLTRIGNANGNAIWGEAGEVNVDIVRGIPTGDHTLDNIQIRNNTLYVGIGARTNNGRTGNFTGQNFHDTPAGPVPGGFASSLKEPGFTYGDTSYSGSIATIRDLTLVPNTLSAAQLRDGPNGTSGNLLSGRDAFLPSGPRSSLPYTSTANDKLVVHSAGTRNPYGLAVDSSGQLWFTNNYSRSESNGDGTSTPHFRDLLDSDLSNDVADQFFRAVPGGDYGYDNQNFRGTPAFPTNPVTSKTFDNLYSSDPRFGQLHDPANPDGLGPSSSSNGLDFATLDLTGLMATDAREYALITRWNGPSTEEPPGTDTLDYRDIVAVDPTTGLVRRVAEGFENPIDVVSDGQGGYLIGDFAVSGTVWRITPRASTSRWASSGGGTWSNAASWSGGVPDGVGVVANMTGAIQSDAQVFVDAPRTLGTLNFDSPRKYTLTGSSTLTIDVAAGFGAINVINGSHEIQNPVRLLKNTTIDVRATGSLRIGGTQSATAGVTLTKSGGGILSMKHVRSSGLMINAGTLQILSDGSAAAASQVATLALAGGAIPTATLDLTNNDLIVSAGSTALLQQQIVFARDGGAWDRPGLTSSFARTNPAHNTTLGVLSGSQYASVYGAGSSFDGFVVDANNVLVKYTYYGDTDFNGAVDFDDYSRTDSGFLNGGTDWFHGDFDLNGVVDFDDYSLIDLAFNTQSGTLRRALAWVDGSDRSDAGMNSPALQIVQRHFTQFGNAYTASFLSAVPEPGTISIFGAAFAGALLRRRPRRRSAELAGRGK